MKPARGSKHIRYTAAPGSPFTDKQAEVIGRALAKIAESCKVDDIRSLNKHVVFAAIKADPKHPLRKFYNWNVHEAARAHWLDRTLTLIRSVQIIYLDMPEIGEPQPMFVTADKVPVMRGDKFLRQRAQVLRSDLLRNDPIFMSAIGRMIRALTSSLKRLEALTSSRQAPREVKNLIHSVRSAINEYEESVGGQAAE